jgi:uncharacterized glyoxalase superfamily protein PhnB
MTVARPHGTATRPPNATAHQGGTRHANTGVSSSPPNDDAAGTFDRAVAAGARIVTALEDSAWGDWGGRLRDPLGNIWWVVQHVEDVAPDEVAVRMRIE